MSDYDYDMAGDISRNKEHQLVGKFLLDLTNDLEDIKLNLLGLRLNPMFGQEDVKGVLDMREYLKDDSSAMVNQMGANLIYQTLKMELMKIVSVTNVPEEKINKETLNFDFEFGEWLYRNYRRFEIDPGSGNFTRIHNACVRLIIAAWNASRGGWRGALTLNHTNQKEVIVNNEQEVIRPRLGGLMRR